MRVFTDAEKQQRALQAKGIKLSVKTVSYWSFFAGTAAKLSFRLPHL